MKYLKDLKDLVNKSNKILFFTGAGISTNSGIPDYRGPKGIWKIREPVYFNEFIENDEKKTEYWNYMLEGRSFFNNAKPNKAHYAIVEFEKLNKLIGVVTQNIDNLHIKAGTSKEKLIELHGNNSTAICLNCNRLFDTNLILKEFEKTKLPPKCSCEGYLKPNVVMFGETLDSYKLSQAFKLAEECDLCIAIGSTLSVQPASLVCYRAWEKGKPYAIINHGKTEHDNLSTLKIEDDIEMVLSDLISGIYETFTR